MCYFRQIAKSALGVKKGLPWKEENGNYIITAYFKDPSLICSHRPSQAKYIGDRLLIQKSSTPYEFIHVPLLEDGLFKSAWTEGECFWSMGKLARIYLRFNPLHLTYVKGTRAEMRPAVVSGMVTGDAPVNYSPIFSPFLSYTPRDLCETYLDRPSFLLMSQMLWVVIEFNIILSSL